MTKKTDHDVDEFVTTFLQSLMNEADRTNKCMECVTKSILLSMVGTVYINTGSDTTETATMLARALLLATKGADAGLGIEIAAKSAADMH
tara:strand:- start:7049 stop:7318 length:270 start_codon:yes stop_codon:yes gene_type:complete